MHSAKQSFPSFFFEEFHFKLEISPEKVLPPLETLPPETANNSDLFAFPCFSVKY